VTGNVVMVNQAVFGFYPVSDASKLQVKLLSTNGQLGFKMADLRSTWSAPPD